MYLLKFGKNYTKHIIFVILLFANVECNQKPKPALEFPKNVTNGTKTYRTRVRIPPRYALSATYLIYLAQAEQIIYSEVKSYAASLRKRLELADVFLKDYEESSQRATDHLDLDGHSSSWTKSREIASNPLTSFRMVRRFAKEFANLENNLKSPHLEKGLLDSIKRLKGTEGFPGPDDYKEALETILRIQLFYDLNTDELSKGKVMDIQTNVTLTQDQCTELGKEALKNQQYTLALQWFKTTNKTCKKRKKSCTSSQADAIRKNLKDVVQQHDKQFENTTLKETAFMFTNKLSVDPKAKTVKEVKMAKYFGSRNKDNDDEINYYNFFSLCNGHDLLGPKLRSKLYCWLETKRNPYFTIFPLKMELIHKYPYVVQIYDIVSNAWILEFWRKGSIDMTRPPTDGIVTGIFRTATYSWLEDEDIPNIPIRTRANLITGLRDTKDSENLVQVSSYAFGGYVSNHVDYLFYSGAPYVLPPSDKLGTFIVYMTDVERGGITAFPRLGVTTQPIKNSALFWWSTNRVGRVDIRTVHGSCPVVYGHKWILTKWPDFNSHYASHHCEASASPENAKNLFK